MNSHGIKYVLLAIFCSSCGERECAGYITRGTCIESGGYLIFPEGWLSIQLILPNLM
jgi:hypothetical protein